MPPGTARREQAPLHAHSGGNDLFVLKLNSSGAYQWHTFYGSARLVMAAMALAVDTSGNVYVTGIAMPPGTARREQAPLNAHSGDFDLFVLKLNSSGAYQWHTFYGSGETDCGLCPCRGHRRQRLCHGEELFHLGISAQ